MLRLPRPFPLGRPPPPPSTATSTTLVVVRFTVAVVRTPLQTRTRAYFWRRRITLVVVVVAVVIISTNNPGRLNPARPSPLTWIGRRVPVGPAPGRAPRASTTIVVVVIGIGHGCGPGADGIRVARRRRDAAVGAVFANANVHGVHAVRSPVGAAHSNVNAAIRKVGVAVVESSEEPRVSASEGVDQDELVLFFLRSNIVL